jgi:UDP-N-acetylglucosamine transferase subunit ALG13
MIFVTVGTNHFPFDRLLHVVERLVDVDEELIVQHGPSHVRPRNARCVEFLPFREVLAHVRRARVVVSHAGIGSILLSLAEGKHPIVVPRRACFGETTDDHQVESARRLEASGLVTAVCDPSDLPAALCAHHEPAPTPAGEARLILELRDYIRAAASNDVGSVTA